MTSNKTNAVKVNKKKSFADIYTEILYKAESVNNLPERLLGLQEALKTFRQLMADPASKKLRYLSFPTQKKINFVNILYEEEIKYLQLLVSSKSNPSINFIIKEGLDEIIFKDYISQFGEIEKGLMSRNYLSDKYQWLQNKKTFCEFLVVVINLKYPKISDIKLRRFFEIRYGKEEKYLSEMFKKSKRPNFDTAKIPFHFIAAPEKS